MRRSLPVLVALLAALCVVAWLLLRRGDSPHAIPAADEDARRADGPPAAEGRGRGARLGASPAVAARGGGPSPAGTAPPAEDAGPNRVALVGRVVGERRLAVADAEVKWRDSYDASAKAAGRTDAGGRFRLDLRLAADDQSVNGTLFVHAGARGAALRETWSAHLAGEVDVGTIELAPTGTVRVTATDLRKPVAGAHLMLWARLRTVRPVVVAEGTTDAEGRALFEGVPSGAVNVWGESQDGWTGQTDETVKARETTEVTLRLSRTTACGLRVTRPNGEPIAGAETVVLMFMRWSDRFTTESDHTTEMDHEPARPVPPTGEDGRTRIEGVPANGKERVRVTAPGFAAKTFEVAAPETTVVLEPELESLFLLDAEEPGQPSAGARVRVRLDPPLAAETEARVDGRGLWVKKPNESAALAVAPDGKLAVLEKPGETVVFRPPRRLEVTFAEPSGAPLAGLEIVVSDPGGTAWTRVVRTDAKGAASFDSLPATKVEVNTYLGSGGYGVLAGSVDLSEHDGELRVTFAEPRTVLVRTTVDGDPRLPEGLALWIDDAVVLRREEDGSAGTVRVEARPRDPAAAGRLHVDGRGLRGVDSTFSWPAPGQTVTAHAALGHLGTVTTVVRVDPGEGVSAAVERFDPERGRWRREQSQYIRQSRTYWPDLAVGRWRLVDMRSGIVSAPFDVVEGGAPLEVELDVTALVSVAGRVEAPEGTKYEQVGIRITGPGFDDDDRAPHTLYAKEDGSFRVRVPPRGRYVLAPRHRVLRPAREGGSAVVDGPRDDVILRLVEGPRARIRLLDPDGAALSEEALEGAKLAVPSADAAVGRWTWLLLGPDDGPSLTARGLHVGRLEAFLDVPPFAPRRLDPVTIGEDVTDLGEVRLGRGSTLFVRFKGRGGKPPKSVPSGEASHEQVRMLTRDLLEPTVEGGPWRVLGLSAGKWTFHVTWESGGHETSDVVKVVEVDGTSEVTVELQID